MITICRGVQNMDDLEHLLVDVETGLVALQKLQDLYDADLWAIQSPPFAKFRHIVIHITILAGELSKLGEAWEHESHMHDVSELDISSQNNRIGPCIADLLIHASQLANIVSEEMYPVLVSRFQENAERFSPKSKFAHITGSDETPGT